MVEPVTGSVVEPVIGSVVEPASAGERCRDPATGSVVELVVGSVVGSVVEPASASERCRDPVSGHVVATVLRILPHQPCRDPLAQRRTAPPPPYLGRRLGGVRPRGRGGEVPGRGDALTSHPTAP